MKRSIQLHHQRPTLPPSRRRARPPHNTKTLPRTRTKPPAPRDPWAGIDAERKFYCKQIAELLEPIVNRGVAARALKQLSQGDSKGLPEGGQRVFTVLRLGQYEVSLDRERENDAAYPFGQRQRHGDRG